MASLGSGQSVWWWEKIAEGECVYVRLSFFFKWLLCAGSVHLFICVSTRSWHCSTVLRHQGGAASVQMCVYVCDILGGVWAAAVSDFCSIQITRQLERVCILKCLSPPLPLPSPLPVSALSPPSRRPQRCRGRRQTPRSITWPMSPSTASWRSILQPWSCSTPPVSKKAS